MLARPRVSVIIPTYNHARFVTQAVQSALSQTYREREGLVEVIVIDDGSTDDTASRLAPYEAQIRYLYQDNQGVAAARNAGIAAAGGEYLVFLDADDLLPPDKLQVQVPLLAQHPHWGLVYSGFRYVDAQNRSLQEIRPGAHGNVLEALLRRQFFFPPGAALVRRSCLDRVGLFDPDCPAAADTDLWVRIAHAGYAFGCTDQPLFHYRVVPDSMSQHLANQARDEFTRLDKFFASPGLSRDVQALREEAYALLHYEFAAKYYDRGELASGRKHLRDAITICPPLSENEEWLLEWIAGYLLTSHRQAPQQLINLMFDNLPPEAGTLSSLRRRALGRYHAAAAFSAYRSGRPEQIRRHILPALRGEPAMLRNRGFLRVSAAAFFSPAMPG